jgi:four helix bundle protein
MRDWRDDLQDRTQAFASAAIDVSLALADLPGLRESSQQLNSAATSVGSNHRAMRRARSDREFAAKLQIVLEEADESVYWLELACRRQGVPANAKTLLREARELRAIFAKARSTTGQRLGDEKGRRRGRQGKTAAGP